MRRHDKLSVCCIGAGYIGGPTMAYIALMNPSVQFYVCDVNEDRISAWNGNDLPIYEPGLDVVVRKTRGVNLHFTTDVGTALRESDVVFVGVNTPTKSFGVGEGVASDLTYWESAARTIRNNSNGDKIVVNKSTLPIGAGDRLEALLNEGSTNSRFIVLSNPEFLAEGSAIKDLGNPDRVVIGFKEGSDEGRAAADIIAGLYGWIPKERIAIIGRRSAELVKLASNAMLAQRVSSINTLADLCSATGADITQVSRCVGMDHRIGDKFLVAGPGFGGSCFKKDVLNLSHIFSSNGLAFASDYWRSVVEVNEKHVETLFNRLYTTMGCTMNGKRIAMLGFAFKANSGDTRETTALLMARLLVREKANVRITDPKALANAMIDTAGMQGVSYFDRFEDAISEADAIVVMTDWDEYRHIDWSSVAKSVSQECVVLDTRNCIEGCSVTAAGLRYCRNG